MKFNFKKVYIAENNNKSKKTRTQQETPNQKLLKFPDDYWQPDAKKEISD